MTTEQRKPVQAAGEDAHKPDSPGKPLHWRRKQASWLDRVLSKAFVVATLFVAFLVGALVTEFKLGAYTRFLERPFRGLRAYWEKETSWHGTRWPQDTWWEVRENEVGVTTYSKGQALDGFTLYSSAGDPSSASLIDMSGDVVHRWHLPFREVWPQPRHVGAPVSEERIYWRRTHLYPNGDLLALYVSIGDTPSGYGLARIDENSQLLWKFSQRVHHDFDVGEDSRVYVLMHRIRPTPLAGIPHLSAPMIEDFVAVLSEEGRLLDLVSVYEAFAESDFRHVLISTKPNAKGDHLHVNAVEIIGPEFARHHGFATEGHILLSMRNNDAIGILDLEKRQIVWAMQGIWRAQHDPDALANGNLLIFDNKGHRGPGGGSRLLEFNPTTTRTEWALTGTKERPLDSFDRSSQQSLPNGNILVTEARPGRIFEVTRDKEIVWEYFSPDRGGENDELVAVVSGALRLEPDDVPFLTSDRERSSCP